MISVTGETGNDEEREARVAELAESPKRVLVATDCLSEGINLQDHFDAVLHYDLPWNPNLCVLKIDLTLKISDLRTVAFWLNQSCRLFR